MISFFHTTLYIPIYNLLIFITGVIPGGDVGIAVIVVTLLVKVATSPLSISAVKTQRRMKAVEPALKHIKEKYKDDKEKQARETMALYKNSGIHPFASILGTLIQLPIIISLYQIFIKEQLLHADIPLLYAFVPAPDVVSPLFLNIFPIVGHSIPLAMFAGIFQYLQAYFSIQIPASTTSNAGTSDEFARILAVQARYMLPAVVAFIAYTSGAIALYFITSSIFGVLQELYIRRTHPLPKSEAAAAS